MSGWWIVAGLSADLAVPQVTGGSAAEQTRDTPAPWPRSSPLVSRHQEQVQTRACACIPIRRSGPQRAHECRCPAWLGLAAQRILEGVRPGARVLLFEPSPPETGVGTHARGRQGTSPHLLCVQGLCLQLGTGMGGRRAQAVATKTSPGAVTRFASLSTGPSPPGANQARASPSSIPRSRCQFPSLEQQRSTSPPASPATPGRARGPRQSPPGRPASGRSRPPVPGHREPAHRRR